MLDARNPFGTNTGTWRVSPSGSQKACSDGSCVGATQDIVLGDFDSFSEVFYNLVTGTKPQAEDPSLQYKPVNVRNTQHVALCRHILSPGRFLSSQQLGERPMNSLWHERIHSL